MIKLVQTELFAPEKGAFDQKDFENCVCGTFEMCLKRGVLNGFAVTQSRCASAPMSKRCMSTTLHEDVYNGIRAEIEKEPSLCEVEFVDNLIGTERLVFMYKDYLFIVRKDGSPHNWNKTSMDIYEQNYEKHIVILTYGLDLMRTRIQSIRLSYEVGGECMYDLNLGTSLITAQQVCITDVPAVHVAPVKPVIKIKKKKTHEL